MYIFDTNRSFLPDEVDARLRKALRLALAATGRGEEWLAKEIHDRTGRKVSKSLITAWKAETRHRWRLPAELVPLICEILDDDSIQRLLLSDKQTDALELGKNAPRVARLFRKVLKEQRRRSNR